MATHVALLRGINVGGRHRLPMAEARAALTEAGLAPLASYIQSGNLVVTWQGDEAKLAELVRTRLEAIAGFPVPTVALTVDDLARVLASNPFTPAAPKLEHVVLLPSPVDDELRTRLHGLASADTSSSRLHVGLREVYLDHPDGLSNSPLAEKAVRLLSQGTARNLASLLAVADLAARTTA